MTRSSCELLQNAYILGVGSEVIFNINIYFVGPRELVVAQGHFSRPNACNRSALSAVLLTHYVTMLSRTHVKYLSSI